MSRTAFGKDYCDNLFACCFNMRKITRHVLKPAGATFQATTTDFLVSNNLDFHPTDILEDADGSLIVIDTGGWYKLCCPTSQLWKPDILGAIYRIRRKGAAKIDDPRGTKLGWKTASIESLTKGLGDPRPVVRRRAIEQMAKRGQDALPTLAMSLKDADPEVRRHALWSLVRISGPSARAAVRAGLADPDESVRQVAAHCTSVWRDRQAFPQVVDLLTAATAHNRRVAAEALGRIGDKAAVEPLLAAAGRLPASAPDRILEHSLIYALIEIADPAATRPALASDNASIRRAALIAIDQMPGGGLDPKSVASLLASRDPLLKQTASWIIGRHREWGETLAGSLHDRLYASSRSDAEQSELEQHLAQFSSSAAVQTLLAGPCLIPSWLAFPSGWRSMRCGRPASKDCRRPGSMLCCCC